MKLLLYCTKNKMNLRKSIKDKCYYLDNGSKFNIIPNEDYAINGKIVAECDYEVEEIKYESLIIDSKIYYYYELETMFENKFYEKSCLDNEQLKKYLGSNNGYAIHIKNLHIFDKPRELSEYYGLIPKKMNDLNGSCYVNVSIDKAPQNMMYALDDEDNECVLISIRPEWLCKILNGEKTIEVRKKVLKEMIR